MSFRKQYKSCDECRRSRIGCDAHLYSGSPCSNCRRRAKTCSTHWLNKRKENLDKTRRGTSLAADLPKLPAQERDPSEAPATPGQVERREQALRLHHTLWETFTTLFEPQLGLWIGNDCNPFKRITTAPKTLVSRLMVTLDIARCNMKPETSIIERLRLPVAAPRRAGDDDNMDTYVNQALMSAVHAFSSRWLPAGFFNTTGSDDQAARRRFMQTLWDQAHADVLCVLTLPCYRSILALYLFAITPLVGSSAMHPVSQMCYETSLRHYLQLRLESRISLPDVGPNQHVPNSTDRDELDHLEDSAYWFGIVCDVSRSLLRCQPPIVLSGPSAHARVWQLVSRQVEDFAAQSISMHTSKDILDDATVLQILQMGSSCKTMCWAAITDVQDTLFYERTSLSFQQSLSFCLDMLQQFEAIFLPLLDKCARDFLLLSDKSRLGYVWLVLHFNLGVLILADTLVAGSVALTLDNQVSIDEHRLASTRAVVNVINLVRQLDSFNMDQPSLLLRDPYPEHASNCLNRAAKSVLGLVQAATITADAAAIFASALLQGLQIISQISFSASEALPTLLNLLHDNGIPVSAKHSSSQTPMGANVSIVLDSAVTPEMLEHETLKELGQQAATDPALVSKTIERHEAAEATPNFGLDYLQFIDFTAVTGDWDFDDCFAGA